MVCIYMPRHLGEDVDDQEMVPPLPECPEAARPFSSSMTSLGPHAGVGGPERAWLSMRSRTRTIPRPSSLFSRKSASTCWSLVSGLPGGMDMRQIADAARELRAGMKVLFHYPVRRERRHQPRPSRPRHGRDDQAVRRRCARQPDQGADLGVSLNGDELSVKSPLTF